MGDGVYILRTKLSGTTGFYVGKTSDSVWSRISKHSKKRGCWKDGAAIGHKIIGVEVIFERVGNHKTGVTSDAPSQIECTVASAYFDRYSVERVYGGGYSKQRGPGSKYNGYRVTPEFKRGVENTPFSWIMDYVDKIKPETDSPHFDPRPYSNGVVGEENIEREWRVFSEPPLIDNDVSEK